MTDPLPGDIFQVGQVLNNTYEIEGILGRGGTGEVYRARNQISDRIVALKALNAQFSGNEDYLELMKREEQMRNIIHDAVVRYSDNSRTDQGHVFLVMDFVDGPSMNDLLERGGMEPRDLLIIAHRVAEGLAVTHRNHIVHRDLSPDNIILRNGDPEQAVIIDFGIAKDNSVGAKTIVGNEFAGKYEYAAPEQMEGKAEARSDLYSLGALLLAGFRGQIPFQGTTPGEIVRRKDKPLDSDGVPEPLRGLIDWLAAPALEDRPRDADEVVDRLNQILKTKRARSPSRKREPTSAEGRGRALKWIGGLVLIGAVGAGIFFSDVLRDVFTKPLQVVEPYTLSASLAPSGDVTLEGYAPDEETRLTLRDAFAGAAGAAPGPDAIELADGMPRPDWAEAVEALIEELGQLEDWSLDITNDAASVEGLAKDIATRDAMRDVLDQTAGAVGLTLQHSLVAGPRLLETTVLEQALRGLQTCGPLQRSPAEGDGYPLGANITITGQVAAQEDAQAIEDALKQIIGDRALRVDTVTLNPDLCAVRSTLPGTTSGALSIWLGYGDTNEANLSGIYNAGDIPVAEVHVPATVTNGSLWVMVVDNTNRVFHVLPHQNRLEHDLADIGETSDGIRRVRVLHSAEEWREDNTRFATRIGTGSYGKSEVIAIHSDKPLFGIRRPRDESIASIVDALNEVVAAGEIKIYAIASRLIDARP